MLKILKKGVYMTDLTNKKQEIPDFETPKEFTSSMEYLRHLALEGLKNRIEVLTDTLEKRLEHELDIISKLDAEVDVSNYLLIVADYINWARKNDIPVGPGRGTSTSSLVCYALSITDIIPTDFGLIFELFINPERKVLPDIDIDFSIDGRELVVDYIAEKYGKNRVGLIAAYGIKKGKVSYVSTHACGVIISKKDLSDYVPVLRLEYSDLHVCQYDSSEIANYGLVKFDILGLKTLDIMQKCKEIIRKKEGQFAAFSISDIPFNDKITFELFCRGDTDGIYQFEFEGIKDELQQLQPDCFFDLVNLYALYRLGLMDKMPLYIERKNGKQAIEYPHPCLENILKDTYGIILYQEQIMQIFCELTFYSFAQANYLRSDLMKSDVLDIESIKSDFCSHTKFDSKEAGRLFDILYNAVNTTSNTYFKSHAIPYVKLGYQTAYLKANFPDEFKSALESTRIFLGKNDF